MTQEALLVEEIAAKEARKPYDYYHKTYGITLPHSDVVDAAERILAARNQTGGQGIEVLDLGCGQGRNSLYLYDRGFHVTSMDHNPNMLKMLASIMDKEGIVGQIPQELYDINQAKITGSYDFIISTVVLMFVDKDCIPNILRNMQERTKPGGYNLIVSGMSTAKYPYDGFSFAFDEGELRNYYKDWEFIRYNEDVGEMHRRDASGNRTQLQFATMLARKPESP